MSTDLTPDPEGQAPAPPSPWAPFEQAGITPDKAEEVVEAYKTIQGLGNLDTRQQYLDRLINPQYDPYVKRGQEEPAEEESDPFEQVYGEEPQIVGYQPDGTPVFDQPFEQQQAPGFDPRTLAPVFDTYTQHAKNEAVEAAKAWLGEQMRDQALTQGVQHAAAEHKLNDFDRGIVENLTRQAVSQQPNRAPADIANDVAKQYVDNMNRRFVEQSGAPVERPGAPGGPAPGEERPKTEAEAMEWSRRTLTPGI